MRARGIFLVRNGAPTVLSQTAYKSEDVLQEILAKYPEVLAGGTTTEDAEVRRLVLVKREMGIPSTAGGSDTFSLDHMFIDEAGVPVFVEVKRSSDTRIRREVVGQMLDYAANAMAYWPVDGLQRALTSSNGGGPDEALREAFGDTVEPEAFWRTVQQNLKEGNVRLVFVADSLPAELVRIIEFLNERMSPTEVLGVELTQYAHNGEQLFVPELIGKTARAVATKRATQGRLWDEATFFEQVDQRHGEPVAGVYRSLVRHVLSCGGSVRWGKGVSPGFGGWYLVGGRLFAVYGTNAGIYESETNEPTLYVRTGELRDQAGAARFDQFIAKLREIPAYETKLAGAAAAGWTNKYPAVSLALVARSPEDVDRLLAAFELVSDREAR